MRSLGHAVTILDMNNNKKVSIVHTDKNPFCAGHAQMADGRILIIGGDEPHSMTEDGHSITNSLFARRTFTPCSPGDVKCAGFGKFENLLDMTTARWYPSVVTLGSGENIVVSGSLRNL